MLTEDEAYDAMFIFLEEYWERGKRSYEQIGGLLSAMQKLGDGKPADSAMWEDWIDCVKKVKEK